MEPAEAVPAPAASIASESTSKAPATAQHKQLNDDQHVDYRYCLELKTNREIAECRYKKK